MCVLLCQRGMPNYVNEPVLHFVEFSLETRYLRAVGELVMEIAQTMTVMSLM